MNASSLVRLPYGLNVVADAPEMYLCSYAHASAVLNSCDCVEMSVNGVVAVVFGLPQNLYNKTTN